MSTTFTAFLILAGLFTAMCIWSLNLKINRRAKFARRGSLAGILVLFVMLLYSVDYIKDTNQTILTVVALSVGMTIVWILACIFFVGIMIILFVGAHWLFTMFKNHSLSELWDLMKADFAESSAKIKAWIEGEE